MPEPQTQELPAPIDMRAGIAPTDNSATIALLQHWAAVDATDDPKQIAQAEQALADFMASLNANRPPDRPIFP